MPKTVKLAFDGEMVECLVVAKPDEILCLAKDGRFVKFAPDVDLKTEVKKHNQANAEVPITAEEADAQQAIIDEWMNAE